MRKTEVENLKRQRVREYNDQQKQRVEQKHDRLKKEVDKKFSTYQRNEDKLHEEEKADIIERFKSKLLNEKERIQFDNNQLLEESGDLDG